MTTATYPAGFMGIAAAASLSIAAGTALAGSTLTVALETDACGFDAVKGGVLGSSAGSVSSTIHEALLTYDASSGDSSPAWPNRGRIATTS